VTTIADDLLQQHFFAGLDEDAVRQVAECAFTAHFPPGAYLSREGEVANTFYVIDRGRVAIEIRLPYDEVVIDTAHGGDDVGWSWLVPPYRYSFDVKALEDTDAFGFDAVCLRAKCEADPVLGYALLQRVVHVMSARLQATRVRLLDVYGQRA
jgi:CRP-like cAMP-binding protein